MLLRGILVSLLLPVWIAAGLVAVGYFSLADGAYQGDGTMADTFLTFEEGSNGAEADSVLATVGPIVLVAGIGLHVLVAWVISRPVAAMTGSVGGLIGTALAGIGALALAAAPTGDRVDELRELTRPLGIVAVGIISILLGFRAYLAHMGRWRYSKLSYGADDGWDDGGWGDD